VQDIVQEVQIKFGMSLKLGARSNLMPKAKYSPCIKVCTYDEQGYCLGCQRTAEEVTTWRNRTEEEQLAGIEMLRERRLWRATESL